MFSFVFGSAAGLAAAFACARGFGFAFAFTTACTPTAVLVNRGGTAFAFACAFTFTTACRPTAVLVNRGGISRVTATAGLLVVLVMSACLSTAEPDIQYMNLFGTISWVFFDTDDTQILASRQIHVFFYPSWNT